MQRQPSGTGPTPSHESLTHTNYDLNNDLWYLNNNDLWRANNAAKQAAEKAAKQTEEAAEEKEEADNAKLEHYE